MLSIHQNLVRGGVILLLTTVLASCQREIPSSDVVSKATDEIVFSAAGPAITAGVTTKASAVTSLSSFNASAVTGAVSDTQVWTNVSFSGDNEDGYKGDKWWPVEDQNYRFFASNLSLTYSSSGATVAATNATDVVCAYSASPSYKTRNTLSFEHIFARLGSVTVSAATGYTISNVSITVVPKTGGTYNLKTGAGQTDGTGWSSVSAAGSPSTIASATGANANDVYLVPGTYTLTASWRAVRGDYTEDIEGMQCDVDLVAGKINNISTTLSGNAKEVVFGVSLSAWSERNTDVTFPTESLAIPGEFSISSTEKVKFAKGNLQAVIGGGPTDTYNYSASEWKFAEHQYDFIGNAAGNTSFAVGSTVDLFGWVGESATYDSYGLCTKTEGNNAYYGTSVTEPIKTDWGSIPGVVSAYGDGWYTLSSAEWKYVISDRTSGATVNGTPNARYTCATINTDGTGVNGIILFPDGVTIAAGEVTTWGAINNVSNWATKCTTVQWSALESKGCVFLPASGSRNGKSFDEEGPFGDGLGNYWSSTPGSDYASDAYSMGFFSVYIIPQGTNYRCYGFSVRLVKDAN